MTDDFVSPLAQDAVAIHEAYTSFLEAGFTEGQAMNITIAMITSALKDD